MTSKGVNVVVVGDITEDEMLPKLSFLKKLPNKKIEFRVVNPATNASRKNKDLSRRCKKCCAI